MSNVKELKRLRDKYFQCAWSLKSGLSSVVYVDSSNCELNKIVQISQICRKFDSKFNNIVGTAIKESVKAIFDRAIKEAEVKQAVAVEKDKDFTGKRILKYIRDNNGISEPHFVNIFGAHLLWCLNSLAVQGRITQKSGIWVIHEPTLTELVLEFMRDGVTTAMISQEFGGRGLVIHTTLKIEGLIFQHQDGLWYNKPQCITSTVLEYIRSCNGVHTSEIINKFGNVTKTQEDIFLLRDEGSIYTRQQLWHARCVEEKNEVIGCTLDPDAKMILKYIGRNPGVSTKQIHGACGQPGKTLITTCVIRFLDHNELIAGRDSSWYIISNVPITDTVLKYIRESGGVTSKEIGKEFGKQKLWILRSLREDGLIFSQPSRPVLWYAK